MNASRSLRISIESMVVAVVLCAVISQAESSQGFHCHVAQEMPTAEAGDNVSCAKSGDATEMTDNEIQDTVERLFKHDNDDTDEKRLKSVGRRATPYLVKALRDTKRTTIRFGKDGDFIHPISPLDRMSRVLDRIHLPDIVEPLTKYLDHEDERVRWCAGRVFGKLASKECIAQATKGLNDDDDYVVSHTMTGIRDAIREDGFDTEFLNAMFPVLQKLVQDKDRMGDKDIARLMLLIDEGRAVRVLTSDEVLTIDNRQVCFVIGELNKAEIKVPHECLLPFLRAAQPLAIKPPMTRAYAEALKAYGRNPDDGAEALLRAEIKSEQADVQTGAAEGIAALFGVHDALNFVLMRYESDGFEGLTTPQRNYLTVYLCDVQTNNGGFSSYFVNSYGEYSKEAIAGFEAIGAVERAKLLREAIKPFGPKGPAFDKSERDRQRAAFTPADEKTIDDLNTPYYKCRENVRALLADYASRHAKHFRD